MKILLCGYTGHMGQEVRRSVERAAGCEILCGVDPLCPEGEPGCVRSFADCPAGADVIIDFSHHSLTASLLDFAESRGLPVVLATTGQTEEERPASGRRRKSFRCSWRPTTPWASPP